MNPLQKIQIPVATELAQCRDMFDLSLHHTSPLLNHALEMIGSHKGKMMRPIMVLLVSKLFGEIDENARHIACAYEAFHTASLVHDDVVDESNERRGQKSVNSESGNKVAVLAGDYILATALHHLSVTNTPVLVDIMAEAAKCLADGELLQLHNVDVQNISEETYFQIIRNKTAALFSACAHSAALNAKATEQQVEQLKSFGEIVGICFQIRDDIFDYSNDNIGKPTGNDMKEGKLTLPVIYALNTSGDADMSRIAHRVKKLIATPDEIAQLVSFTKDQGGIEYAISSMNSYAQQAKDILNQYPDNAARQALLDYVDYVVGRTF